MYAQEDIIPYEERGGSKLVQMQWLFDTLSHTYDHFTHLASLGADKMWRKQAVKYLKKTAVIPPRTILDVATGTGDLAICAHKYLTPESIVGIDISDGMMHIATEKVRKKGLDQSIRFEHQDVSALELDSNTFDAVISSFGLRNFPDLDKALSEMHRVMKPQAKMVVIDLCTPRQFPMKQLFALYRNVVMPIVERCCKFKKEERTYLPKTMDAIPQGQEMADIISKSGFSKVTYKRLTFGLCILYAAEKG